VTLVCGPRRLMGTLRGASAAAGDSGAAESRANLAALRELAESGQITPVVERTYPLREAAEAIRYLEVEHARAKVVVTV
jgi:NADPH:quinone reductase-like Zn-dependent oxidoreductase